MFAQNLCGGDVRGYLDSLRESGELQEKFPELQALYGFGGQGQGHKDLWDHTIRVTEAADPTIEARLAALWHDTGKPRCFTRVGDKVMFYNHENVSAKLFRKSMARTQVFEGPGVWFVSQVISNLGLVEAYTSDWTDTAVRRLRQNLGDSVFWAAISLARVDVTSKYESNHLKVQTRMSELAERSNQIAENDLKVPPLAKGLGESIMKAFSIPPSRQVGVLLKSLERAIEEGTLEPRREDSYYIEYLKRSP